MFRDNSCKKFSKLPCAEGFLVWVTQVPMAPGTHHAYPITEAGLAGLDIQDRGIEDSGGTPVYHQSCTEII